MTDGEAIELIKDAAVYADARWIPCRERLLEASSRYLLLIKNDYERRYSKTAWFKGDVTARRSFSEAYMGEENMSLDEAIKYYSHLADECRRKANIERNDYMDLKDLAAEHEQLADWLNELKILREKVRTLLEKQEADRWIPVTKRLPEKEGCYLVTVKNDHERRYSKTAWYSGDGWFARQDIIAWRLTPEPYTEEDNDKP